MSKEVLERILRMAMLAGICAGLSVRFALSLYGS